MQFFLLIQLMSLSLAPPSLRSTCIAPSAAQHHTLKQKKSFVSRTATSCKKRHVYIYVLICGSSAFFAAVASAACFSQLKTFFFSLSTGFFADNKKAVLHSTFYPFSIEHQMNLRRCDGRDVVEGLDRGGVQEK
jgi:hypothetical protein